MNSNPSPFTLALITTLATGTVVYSSEPASRELEKPFRLEAKDGFVDTDIGHAAPWVVDFDGDGKRDLLVGQFGDGKLKIFRNAGTETAPKLGAFAWFQAGGAEGKVPSG
jgi:hypothetical protein